MNTNVTTHAAALGLSEDDIKFFANIHTPEELAILFRVATKLERGASLVDALAEEDEETRSAILAFDVENPGLLIRSAE